MFWAAAFAPIIRSSTSTVTVLRNVRIVDVNTGRVTSDGVIVITGERITASGKAKSAMVPMAARVVDAKGSYAIPGLWDMHVHLVHKAFLGQFVVNGVTGVRDMGGGAGEPTDGCESIKIETLLQWRDLIEGGDLVGPRMLLSGPAITNTGWPTSINIGSPAEARSAVARLKALGADLAKIHEKIPLSAYREFASEARKANLPFAGHVPVDTVSLTEASDAGQKSVEHIRDHLLMCFSPRRSELLQFFRDDRWSDSDVAWGLDQFEECPTTIRAFRRNRTWLVPTLVVERAKISVEDASFVESRKRELLAGPLRKAYQNYVERKHAQSPAERSSERLWWKTQVRLVDRMRRQKVGFLAGTDSSCEGGLPGRSLHEELKLMVESGFTPVEALRTATINPAKYLERESEFGALKQGYVADIVLLNGDPLKRIEYTGDIFAVVVNGRYFDRPTLDTMLRPVSETKKNTN